MKKTVIFALIAAFLFNAQAALAARTIIDHADNKVTVPDKIERIAVVGILPFPASLTVYLGSAKRIIGIPPASMGAAKAGLLGELFPEILKAKTGFSDGDTLNIEELIKLKPDIVFYTAGNKEMRDIIRNAGLCAVGISPVKWDYDVVRTYSEWVKTMSEIFPNSSKSGEVIAYSKEILARVGSKVKNIPENKRQKVLFLFQYDDKRIVTSGKRFFGQYWCDVTGSKNVSKEVKAENSSNVINMEQIYAWNPDVIFITNFTKAMPQDLFGNKIGGDKWDTVAAVKNKRVYKMPLGTYRSFTPGVDTPITVLWMAQKIYPELFKNINIEHETQSYYKKLYGVTLTDKQTKKIFNQGRDSSAGFNE